MIQQCRCCGDFYRRDDPEMQTIETELPETGVLDDGSGIAFCYQCRTEVNSEAQTLEDAWQLYYQEDRDRDDV